MQDTNGKHCVSVPLYTHLLKADKPRRCNKTPNLKQHENYMAAAVPWSKLVAIV